MAITISGENNNDRILASDGVIDQISGINIVGLITASHINVGSNIQLGNAGIITATTFVGNVTGNVNSTSPLLLQTGGSERFRITGNNELGIAGANYGSAGQVLTSGGSGSAVTWSSIPSQVTISNNANNRVITGGTGTNLVGEPGLTFDGAELDVNNGAGSARLYLISGNTSDSSIYFGRQNDGATAGIRYEHGDDALDIYGYNNTRRIRIASNGYVNIGTGSAEQQLTVQNSAQHSLIRVISNTTSDTGVDFGDTADSDIGRIRYSNNGDYMTFRVNNINSVRFDNSARVQIGGGDTPAQVGDGRLIVYSTDRLHPAIKCAGTSNNYANGWTLLGDNYQADESQINLGVSYSSSSLVLSRGVKVSGSADDTYLSSQDSYATRPCAIRMDELGAFNFLTTETNAATTVDSAVSLTEVFKIDRVGNVYQRISGRNIYLGASNQLRLGVQTNGDPNIEAVSGDLKIMKAGSNIMQLRSDGFQMNQGIYPLNNNAKDLGKSGSIWAGVFANYARLYTNLAVGSGNSLQNGNVASFKGNDYNQINIVHSGNNGWGMLLTNSNSNSYNAGYHETTNSSVSSPIAIVNVNNDCLYLATNNSPRWRVEHNGNFIPISSFNIGSSSKRMGTIYATNGTINSSDGTEKNTITESDLGLDFICKLKPVSYKWNQKEGEIFDTKTHYGFISQDVEKVIIETGKTLDDFGAVDKPEKGTMGLSYNEFISPLVKAIQEQQEQIKKLQENISALKSQLK